MEAQGFSKSLLVKRYENSIPSRMKVWKERLAVHKLWRSDESRDELHRQNRSDGRRGSSADIHTWMLWPVLGDDGLSPTSPPASASVKGVNKLAPLLLCAPCKPTSHRKNQNSTQWYVQQVNNTTQHNSQTNSSSSFYFVLSFVCLILYLFRFFVFFFLPLLSAFHLLLPLFLIFFLFFFSIVRYSIFSFRCCLIVTGSLFVSFFFLAYVFRVTV